ncbi:unnamed protein product [Pleuronectes platessa]|uniref:Uncharacterized protein n=1 Tax=Pleuronectes platessa TaxID=8262 RepID=A0A9N7VNY0_PLEPL|nr:unnamed protein product [Pleuronectes platessa]
MVQAALPYPTMTHIISRKELHPLTPPPAPGLAVRMRGSAVSACSAAARSSSPLCFTHSGFNWDPARHPADRAAPEQAPMRGSP